MVRVMAQTKQATLALKSGFNEIIRNPDFEKSSSMFVLLGKVNGLGSARVGISIRKKDYRLATTRNFIKRKIRSSFKDEVDILPSMDFVILVKKIDPIINKKITGDLVKLWRDCG